MRAIKIFLLNPRVAEKTEGSVFHHQHITDEMKSLCAEAGIYSYLWRSSDTGIVHGEQLIELLRNAIVKLKSDTDHYKPFEVKNATIDQLIPWLTLLMEKCSRYPYAFVKTEPCNI